MILFDFFELAINLNVIFNNTKAQFTYLFLLVDNLFDKSGNKKKIEMTSRRTKLKLMFSTAINLNVNHKMDQNNW